MRNAILSCQRLSMQQSALVRAVTQPDPGWKGLHRCSVSSRQIYMHGFGVAPMLSVL